MKIISKQGDPNLAEVYVAKFRDRDELLAEFVDARDPDLSFDKKWVIIVSTQFGCPVSCPMCDAGGNFLGNLSKEEIFAQIDHVIEKHPRERIRADKFKIQFARMGEPALNPNVLEVIKELPKRYNATGLIPCVATIAPLSAKKWFDELLEIKTSLYEGKTFQLQLSINSTDPITRDRLMPAPKISFEELGVYADKFFDGGPRKVALNFALTSDCAVDPNIIAKHFNPASTCVKITPLNPTFNSKDNDLHSAHDDHADTLSKEFQNLGFDVILSIGDLRENQIGSNCGMAVKQLLRSIPKIFIDKKN